MNLAISELYVVIPAKAPPDGRPCGPFRGAGARDPSGGPGPRFRGCNPIPRVQPLCLFLVVPATAGTKGFQSLTPRIKSGAGSGSPLARGRRICLSLDFLTASFRGGDG